MVEFTYGCHYNEIWSFTSTVNFRVADPVPRFCKLGSGSHLDIRNVANVPIFRINLNRHLKNFKTKQNKNKSSCCNVNDFLYLLLTVFCKTQIWIRHINSDPYTGIFCIAFHRFLVLVLWTNSNGGFSQLMHDKKFISLIFTYFYLCNLRAVSQ